MKSKRTQILTYVFMALGFVFVFLCWFFLALWLKSRGNNVVPYPHETIVRVGALTFGSGAGTTWKAIGYTCLRLLLSFAVSFLLAAILGTLAGLFPYVKAFLWPSIAWKKTIPTAAVVIVLIGVLLGLRNNSLVNLIPGILTFLVAFPILYEAFVSGVEATSKSVMDALAVDGGRNTPRAILRIRLPQAWPYIRMGIATSLGLSFKVAVMSEVLSSSSASKTGIGRLIVLANQDGELGDVIAYAIIVLVLMFVIDLPKLILKKK